MLEENETTIMCSYMLLDSEASCSVVDNDIFAVENLEQLGPMKLTNAPLEHHHECDFSGHPI